MKTHHRAIAPSRHRTKNSKGFSLLEVLIGVVILSAMSLLIYTTMNRALSAKVRTEKKDEVLQSVRIGMDKMASDLSQAFMANAAFKGPEAAYQTGFIGHVDSMDFSMMGHFHYIKDSRETDQVSVGYSLKKNEAGFMDLMRRESNTLSDKLDEGGRAFPLIENVKEINFSYYDTNKKEWVQEWDSSQLSVLNRLPAAVKVGLSVVNPEEGQSVREMKEYSFSTIIPIEMYKNEINF